MKSDSFLNRAKALALQASGEVLSLLHQPIHQERKQDQSLVTAADLKSDAIIREGLSRSFPDHAVLTEENGIVGPKDAEFVWLIDPLDGTKAFAKGIAGFSVMVGLLKNGRPEMGVVVDPMEERLYEAVRGGGAFETHKGIKRSIHVSRRDRFEEMPLVVSTGFPEEKMKELRRSFSGPLVNPINSVGIKVGLLVRQEADVYISHHSVHYWDTCAPQAILEEAGGVMTELNGMPLRYDLSGDYSHNALTLATNGRRHEDLRRLSEPLFR